MKRFFLLPLLAFSLALNIAVLGTFGFHWSRAKLPGHRSPHGPWQARHFKKALGLTDQQEKFMEKDRADLEAATAPLREKLHQKRLELMALMKTEPEFSSRVEKTVGEITQLQARMEKNFIQHSFALKKTLSPDQQKKFMEQLEQGMMRMHAGPGRFRGKGAFPSEGPEHSK